MPRFLVERVFDAMDDEEMLALATRAKQVMNEHFSDITWEHSHVCADDEGRIVSYCVYTADNTARIHEHAEMMGRHQIERIYEIGGDIDPAELSA